MPREPQQLGGILANFLKKSGLREKLRSSEIYDCWPEIVGAEASKHSRVVGITNCVLHIEVDSAPWLQVLSSFRKKELLEGIRQRVTAVRVNDIKFKIGARSSAEER